MNKLYNKHYIRADAEGRVIHGFSDAFAAPQSGDRCINEQGGYQFRLSPDGVENPPLTDMDGVHLYRWDGQAVVETTAARREAERAALQTAQPPTGPTLEARVEVLTELVDAMLVSQLMSEGAILHD